MFMNTIRVTMVDRDYRCLTSSLQRMRKYKEIIKLSNKLCACAPIQILQFGRSHLVIRSQFNVVDVHHCLRVCTVVSFAMDLGIAVCNSSRVWLFRHLGEVLGDHIAVQYFAWMVLPVTLVLFSTGFVHFMTPQARILLLQPPTLSSTFCHRIAGL